MAYIVIIIIHPTNLPVAYHLRMKTYH